MPAPRVSATAGRQADLAFAAAKDRTQLLENRFSEVDDTRFAAPDRPARGETHCTILLYQFGGRKGPEILGFCDFNGLKGEVAEREGFEPPMELPPCRISSAVHSTTLPSLREIENGHPNGCRLVDTGGLMT